MKTLKIAVIIAAMATASHADEPAELFRNYPDMYISPEIVLAECDYERAFSLSPLLIKSPMITTMGRSEKLGIAYSSCVQTQARGYRLRHPRDPLDGR